MSGVGDLINECAYLSFVSVNEPKTNALEIVVDEARISDETHILQIGNGTISGVSPIEVDKNSQRFRIYWPDYTVYSVANETDARSHDYEVFEGRLFRRYAQSFFLDFATKGTAPRADALTPMQHWEIACLNHIVNVISYHPPVISVI
jgi:hypothetical protein